MEAHVVIKPLLSSYHRVKEYKKNEERKKKKKRLAKRYEKATSMTSYPALLGTQSLDGLTLLSEVVLLHQGHYF